MSAAWKIGLGLLLVALSWSLYGWQTQRRLPQVPFPSKAFVPVWTPTKAPVPTDRPGEVLLFFSPDDCGQTVARAVAFWVEGAQALGYRVVGILEDRSRELARRYAAVMGFPFAVWWDSVGWYGRHYGALALPRALVRREGRVVGELGPEALRTVRGVESVRLLLAAYFREDLSVLKNQPEGGEL